MNDYLDGAEADLVRRGQLLLNKIPVHQPREYYLLTQRCRAELTTLLDALRDIKSLSPPERLRTFQRIVAEIDLLEITGFAALNRATDDDRYLNILIERITREINYPLLPPVVTSLSQGYFYIYPHIGLLCVPLGEADALLHLPDLYHELAHPLADERYDPRVQPFRLGLSRSLSEIQSYIATEQERELRSRGPQSFQVYLNTWWKSWNQSWLVEFFCDLFATYMLGPAYAWSNLHLCAKRGGDPFVVPRHTPTSHPADDGRMMAILYGLRLAGFADEADDVTCRWQQFIELTEYSASAEYLRCFNRELLQKLAEIGYYAVQQMGCQIAELTTSDRMYTLFNTAWQQFWHDPKRYARWEAQAVQQLRQELI
ncbi:MAG: hypothetical protein M3R24_36920 [Chloroflexota bacterium]|nr:hypothetical protein [Chloroflexota bacterium]